MTDITKLTQSLKTAANKAGADEWQAKKISGDFYVIRQGSYSTRFGFKTYAPIAEIDDKKTRDFVALASPANVLTLVKALEKAQGMEAYWKTQCRGITDHCEELQARIAELESRTVKLPESIVDKVCLTAAEIHAQGSGVTDDKAQGIIDRIREILTPVAGIKVEGE